MRYAPHILFALTILWIANTPGMLFWIGFFFVAFCLYWVAHPEDKPEVKQVTKREFTIKL